MRSYGPTGSKDVRIEWEEIRTRRIPFSPCTTYVSPVTPFAWGIKGRETDRWDVDVSNNYVVYRWIPVLGTAVRQRDERRREIRVLRESNMRYTFRTFPSPTLSAPAQSRWRWIMRLIPYHLSFHPCSLGVIHLHHLVWSHLTWSHPTDSGEDRGNKRMIMKKVRSISLMDWGSTGEAVITGRETLTSPVIPVRSPIIRRENYTLNLLKIWRNIGG